MRRPIRALIKGDGPSRFVAVRKDSEEFITELFAENVTAGAGLWTEGPNLINEGDFEGGTEPGDWWSIYNDAETVEAITVDPIAGTRSLHILTTGEPDTFEGASTANANDSAHWVSAGDNLRLRFKIRGTIGTVRVRLNFTRSSGSLGPSSYDFIMYEADPGAVVTIERDMVMPNSLASSATVQTDKYRFHLYFWSYGEIADFTIDDVYFGKLTPA